VPSSVTPRRGVAAVAALFVLVPVGAAVADGALPVFVGPHVHGVVGLSETVPYALTGDCGRASVTVVLTTPAGDEVRGPLTTGCAGSAAVPDEHLLAEAGLGEPDVSDVVLRAVRDGAVLAEHPLRLERLQAEHLDVRAGEVTRRTHDGRDGVEVTGASGSLDLGTADLTGLHSLSFTYATDADGSMLCSPLGYDGPHCVAGTVTVTAGPTGPVVAAGELLHGRPGWERIVTPLLHAPAGPVELVVRVDAVPPAHCGSVTTPTSPFGQCSDGTPLVRLDSVDLNGRGASEPYRPPADPPGTVVLFDGSLDGWTATGGATGAFTVEGDELVVRGGFGQLYHEGVFRDYELRLDFKVDSTVANSGVHLRFPGSDETEGYEVQVQDYGFNYPGSRDYGQTGSIYQQQASDRIATHDVGEWNSYAIRVVGQSYTVVLNGREVTRFTGNRALEGRIGLQSHDPSGEVRYRAIRLVPVG
jgi:hypothetical protein